MTAGALLAGAFLSAFLQVVFDRLAFCDVVDNLKGRQCIEGLLQKLKMELMSADEVLIDAEEKQITNPAVKEWLDELEDAVYVADDLLEEIATEALRCKSETTHESVGSEVRALIPTSDDSFDKNIQSELEKILARLEIITKKKDVLYLKKVVVGEPSQPLATSFHEDNAVYGRDIDRETILKTILKNLQSNDASGGEVCVISIVGVGGVGKTTLARLVYNDEKVNDHFDLKAWICVSEKFDSFTIAKTIFKEVISSDRDAQNLNMLQTKIATLVRKKILIVLDDVRNENNIAWDELVAIFGHRTHEIKIIITTCSEEIASIVHPISTHHLSQLSNEDCWLLFARHAFKNRESREYVDLEVIGREIVHKCKGLPLAVKTIGGLLGFKQDPREWKQILESNIWNLSEGESNIIPALKLSYNYLPPHLKRCFAYCSIFPRDYIFLKEELVLFWMAEDLLLKPQGNERMEEIGEQYFDDLESRSFFQRSNSDKSCFIMHDLVYDLAKFISREFVFKLEIKNLCEITRKTLHLSYYKSDFDVSKIVEVSHKAKGLRSLLELEWPSECSWACNDMTKTINDWPSQCSGACNDMTKRIDDLLHKFRCLRVLSLSNIKVLPDSIGNLKHLCYLNLSTTEIQRLPDSICTVYNLQTLLLFACPYLVELPTNMGRLVNLRYLDIRLTPIKEMPLHIGKLRNLQHLSDFRVGKDGGCSIRELGELGHLSGTLCISNLQNVHCSSDANAMEVNLKDKKYLSQLELIWGLDHNTTNHSENDIHVLEQLLPHTNLKSLIIFNFRGKKFPNWLGDGSFSNMVSLKLRHCKYCTLLPPLGQLPALKELEISAFQGLSQVDCATSPFKSLEKLTFEDMRDWKEWFTFKGEDGGKIFHTLQELRIIKCPKLTGNLPSYLPSLTILTIEKCEQLVASLPMTPTLKELHLKDCDQVVLEKLPTTLQSLEIEGILQLPTVHYYPSLESLIVRNGAGSLCSLPLQFFPKLKLVKMLDCANLDSLRASEELCALKLTNIYIYKCKKLKSLPEGMQTLLPSLVTLTLEECAELETIPKGGFPSNLQHLGISRCDKLFARRAEWGLQSLHSLRQFKIVFEGKEVDSFPEEELLPPTLITLFISDFLHLKSLNVKGFQHLTSLKMLKIWGCTTLQCLPEEGLPASLSCLCISLCPSLKQWCQRENGEDWSKIAHIPYIEIDNQVIRSHHIT